MRAEFFALTVLIVAGCGSRTSFTGSSDVGHAEGPGDAGVDGGSNALGGADAGASGVDSGSSDPDAGARGVDSGSNDPDAGASRVDSGSSDPDAGAGDGGLGADAGSGSAADAGDAGCTYSVSGTATESGTCWVEIIVGGADDQLTVVLQSMNQSSLTFAAVYPQASLRAGTYGDDAVMADTIYTSSDGSTWVQLFSGSPDEDQGSYSLTINSAGFEITNGVEKSYRNFSGSLTATLPAVAEPGSTATGTVTVSASF